MIRYAYRKRYFNPRSREGSDRNVQFTSNKTGNFNPRSREGSDQAQRRRREPAPFQSTLPRRERRLPHRSLYRMLRFQSTLPRRERPMMSDLFRQVTAHFNPRSREGSDLPSSISLAAIAISIHAPAKGATPRSRRACKHPLFQSTLPRRERPMAPIRLLCVSYFNPRSREGSDSTCRRPRPDSCYFNPRSREGSDLAGITPRRRVVISIHAPAKGATAQRDNCRSIA